MTVHVERRPDADPAAAEAAGAQLSALIKNTIGVTVATLVQDPDTIERSMGKMRRIIDERPRCSVYRTMLSLAHLHGIPTVAVNLSGAFWDIQLGRWIAGRERTRHSGSNGDHMQRPRAPSAAPGRVTRGRYRRRATALGTARLGSPPRPEQHPLQGAAARQSALYGFLKTGTSATASPAI